MNDVSEVRSGSRIVLGALLTTPEVLTQIMMFIPLQLLFETAVWIARYWERKGQHV